MQTEETVGLNNLIERRFVRKRRRGIGTFGSHCLHVGAPDEAAVRVFASLCVFHDTDIGIRRDLACPRLLNINHFLCWLLGTMPKNAQ
jgi:hypothetical protein